MKFAVLAALASAVSLQALPILPATAEQRCRMETQCRWVNFKKVCTTVKVCRERG